jgi:uncharacterized repeat protein (TIGR01451 family)
MLTELMRKYIAWWVAGALVVVLSVLALPAAGVEESGGQAQGADLALVMTDSPDPATLGTLLTYVITVTNGGSVDAADVVVTDALPAGASLISATPSQGSCEAATCSLGTIAAGGTATVAVVVSVEAGAGATILNSACVVTSVADTNAANNCDEEDTTVPRESPAPATPSLVPETPGPTATPNGLPNGGGSPGKESSGTGIALIAGMALIAIGAFVAFRVAAG